MKIKLTLDCGYVGTDYEEEMEVNDDITEEELEQSKKQLKDAYEEYKTQIDYCVHDGLLMNVDDKLVITRKGFEHYGAIFSLFYSKMEA